MSGMGFGGMEEKIKMDDKREAKNPPSYRYELLHQFEVVFRDGEHRTQDATRDYQKVWENVIDDSPDEGVTPVLVYRMNGEVCAAIAGLDDLISNEECAMEIARLAALLIEAEKILDAMTSSRDANSDALLHISRDKALLSESYQVQIGSLQFQLNEMRDHRDRWYAAAGQRQDELNEAHAAIREMCGLVLAVKAGEPRDAIWKLLKEFEKLVSQNRAARTAMQGKP